MPTIYQPVTLEGYTPEEQRMNNELNKLFDAWCSFLNTDEIKNRFCIEHFVSDGFFPHYTAQNIKILFIGREALNIGGCSYIDIIHKCYKNNYIYDRHINSHPFHRKLFKIAYGLTHGCPHWEEIPSPSDLTDSFATCDGLSFAFMNLSKISNETERWTADYATINSFLEDSAQSRMNFINKEIEILSPDLIITMNFADKFKYLGNIKAIPGNDGGTVHRYELEVNGKMIPLFGTYHFSAVKSDCNDFYNPLVAAIGKL